MSGGTNLASKYAKEVDERFNRESQAVLGVNHDYSFTGVDTVNVYSIPTVPMTDYTRSGTNRYGNPGDLARNVQTLKLKRDRGFTFIIDRGDKIQSNYVSDAGRALARQVKEVWVPEFDTYVFRTMAEEATTRGNYSDEVITKENAYEVFLNAMERMGDRNVPDKDRVAFCSYRYANLLKQDPAFIKESDKAQEMLEKGVIGNVDGAEIVKVPSSKLPSGCAFILCHKSATTAPKQLEQFKTHDNPPGISGWLVEGRVIYDCFVLNSKADGLYYHGSQQVLRRLDVTIADLTKGKVKVNVVPEPENGNKWYYTVADVAQDVAFGASVASWAELPNSGATIVTGGKRVVTVAEADSSGNAVAVGCALLPV